MDFFTGSLYAVIEAGTRTARMYRASVKNAFYSCKVHDVMKGQQEDNGGGKSDDWMTGKRKIWCAIAGGLLLAICACGKGAEGEKAGNEAGRGQGEQEYVYTAEHHSLDGYCESVSAVMLGNDRKVYFTGVKDNRNTLFVLDIDGNGVKEYPLELEQGMGISVIGKDTEGNLLLGVIGYQGNPLSDGTVGSVVIKKLSADGKVLGSVDTGNIFRGKDVGSFYINGLYQDHEGNYYVSASQDVCVLRPDGSLYFTSSVGAYISTMFVMGDGRVVAGYGGRDGWRLEEVDLSRKALKPLESSVGFTRGVYRGGTGNDLFYAGDGALYACSLEDEEPDVLLDWTDCGINGNNIQDFMILPDGRVVAATVDYSAGAARELSILTKKGRSGIPEKTILTYAALYLPSYAERDIVEFNKRNGKYSIEVKVYGDDAMEYSDRAALLNADLAGGQAPDIIDLAASGLSLENLVSAGVAEDLTPYFEDDAAIKREDFLENVIKAYERDGKLYAVMPSFGIRTLAGKVSDVGEGSTWHAEEMMALQDSKGKDAQLLECADKGTMLWLICMLNQGSFIDWEHGSCDFTGGEFRKFLEFADCFPAETDYRDSSASEAERIEKLRSGKLLLLEAMVTSVETYQLYEYEFGEPVNFIGYPAAGTAGQFLEPQGTTVAMNSASENKEGVWEFIKFCLSEERQENLDAINGDGFPVRKSALDKLLREEMEEEYYEDVDGNRKVRPKNTWAVGELNIDAYAATQDQADRIRRMIETAQTGHGMDDKVFGIIYEEAEAYFNGIQSADKTAEIVQNRVQTYLNER